MPRNPNLTPEQRDELVRWAERLPAGRRAVFVKEQAALLGCSESTVYRALERATTTRSRRRRSDAGALRSVDEKTFYDLAALTVQHDFDAGAALDVLNANRQQLGLAPVDMCEATLRRQLNARNIGRRQNEMDLRVHRRWEAPYSNHTHQIDSTVAHCYYIDRDNSVGHETREVLNKNKSGNGRPRVWLIVMVDDHSRTMWGRFYTSEAAVCWRDLMLTSWTRPEDPSTWPAYGLPEKVYSDCGSGLRSLEVRRTLDALGVQYAMAEPSTEYETNAQAKGKIERAIATVQAFELFTKMQRFEDLAEMNQQFQKFLLWMNRRASRTTSQSRFHRWLAGMQDRPLRLMPPADVVARFQFIPTERLISKTLTIQLETKTFQLPYREPFLSFAQKKVPVLYRRHDMTRIIVVLDREEHEIDAVAAVADVAGEFKSVPAPKSVDLKRALQERDLSHIDPHLVHEYRLEKTAETFAPNLIEVPHPLAAEAEAAPVRMVRRGKAIERLIARGVLAGPLSADDAARVNALFAGRAEITDRELEDWIAAGNDENRQPQPRLAVMA